MIAEYCLATDLLTHLCTHTLVYANTLVVAPGISESKIMACVRIHHDLGYIVGIKNCHSFGSTRLKNSEATFSWGRPVKKIITPFSMLNIFLKNMDACCEVLKG
jgi:hypothetical protein